MGVSAQQHRVSTGLFEGALIPSIRVSRRGGRQSCGARRVLGLTLVLLLASLITPKQLLLLAGDVEENPGPVTTQQLTEGQGKLIASAPQELRNVLTTWDPLKTTIPTDLNAYTKPQLQAALAWLQNTTAENKAVKSLLKPGLVSAVQLAIERLLPEECGECKEVYTVEREDAPSLQCGGCHQGFHQPCLENLLGGQAALPAVPGSLTWLCPACCGNYRLMTEVGGSDGAKRPQGGKKCRAPPPLPTQAAPPPTGAPAEPGGEVDRDEENPEESVEEDPLPDCAPYLRGECQFGISGKRGGVCPLAHKKMCRTFMKWGDRGDKGCKKSPCDRVHPVVCTRSLNLECLVDRCPSRIHIQRCRRRSRHPPGATGPRFNHHGGGGHQGGGGQHHGGGGQHNSGGYHQAGYPGQRGRGGQAGYQDGGQHGGNLQGHKRSGGWGSHGGGGGLQPDRGSPPVWDQQQQQGFDSKTVQQLLEAYVAGVRREMQERQEDLLKLVREEVKQARAEQVQLLGGVRGTRGSLPHFF